MILKIIIYCIYMTLMRIKGIKYEWIKRLKCEKDANDYVFKLYRKWADFTVKIVGINIEVYGIENIPKETCVFMCNHTSILDVPILIKSINRNLGFISKKEVLKTPIIGYWLNKGKNVPLDRENPREGMKAISKGVQNLKEGFSMVIFPEGTRSKTGELLQFKKGSLKLATKSKAPIVPVYIDRASKCYEENKKFKADKVKVVFGKPITTEGLTREEEKGLAERLYSDIKLLSCKKRFNQLD